MNRKLQDVSIWTIADRRKTRPTPKPWVVRWRVNGRQFSRAFANRAEADRFRSILITEQLAGTTFCANTGVPLSHVPVDTPTVYQWVRRWVDDQWDTAEPRTRRSKLEALAWFVATTIRSAAPPLTAEQDSEFRRYISDTIAPAANYQDRGPTRGTTPANKSFDRRLEQHSPQLADLDANTLAVVERRLRTRIDGQPRGSSGDRYVKVSKQCVRRAVELGIIPVDPWPATERGQASRKANRLGDKRRTADIRQLPQRSQAVHAIDAMVSHQPGSHTYRVMSRFTLDVGARPSETMDLTVEQLTLPDAGWGEVRITQANVGRTSPGQPKTGPRTVPLHPDTVAILRTWLTEQRITHGYLFRTRTGLRPSSSNWLRTLKRGCAAAGIRPLSPYDLRHICATTMVHVAGVPHGQAALRLGHSVEELIRTYIGTLDGDEQTSNRRLETAYNNT